ncbi:Hypothetical protein, conserved [Brucella canis ATCC 23365]|uniref:Uncharacterized protein n=1 Tax=Brucella canis (strain ATCC 23365 / NCTC 10854 / RM-666) TaxID=483179 RepID=A9M9N7_BRUC2|nr:Hypothetical protein, conserved [Brucella canis ATCC 23365]
MAAARFLLLSGVGALLARPHSPFPKAKKRNFPACSTENRPTKPLETLRNFHLAEIER